MADQENDPTMLRFDASKPDVCDVVRRAFLNRLRTERTWSELATATSNAGFVNVVVLEREQDDFKRIVVDTYWTLVVEGVIAPGTGSNLEPPFFHLTEYGKKTLAQPDFQPHDSSEYLRQLGANVPSPDPSVLAYLKESLDCYSRGTMVASTMMLGIAAERVFLLVCDSLLAALRDSSEQTAFQKRLDANAMKPKLDWLANKFQQIQTPRRPSGWPEDVDIKIPGIYNQIRFHRNELGHPRETPPRVTRDDAYGYLRLFPSYYATAEKARDFLSSNKV